MGQNVNAETQLPSTIKPTTSPSNTSPVSTKTVSQPGSPLAVIARPAWLNLPLYVEPQNTASVYAATNPNAANVNLIARMGQQPVAHWFGDWDQDVTASVNAVVSAANGAGGVPVLVFYNIPQRDCGSYSGGNGTTPSSYLDWVTRAAAGIANRRAVVILEPDAIAGADCLSASDQQTRYSLVAQSVAIIKAQANASVYIDAGNPTWQTAATTANRLSAANISAADGFSLNVSNFSTTALNTNYGNQVSKLVGGKHYVIDTSRNGGNVQVNGATYNPSNAALGSLPTTHTMNSLVDALLWIKIPWESDAQVNGAPPAGSPYWSYAIQLAQNAGWQ